MEFLKAIYYGLLTLSLVTLLFHHKKLPQYCIWFIPLLALGLGVQAASDLLEGRKISSYFLFHIYQPIEFFLLCAFYNQILSFGTKRLLYLFLIIYPLILLFYYWRFPNSFYSGDFFDFTIEAILVCLLVILFLYQLLRNKERVDLKHFTAFWLNAAHLIFYGGCLFVMGLYFYIHNTDKSLAAQILGINHFLNLFLYSAYSTVFLCTTTAKK